MNNFLILHPTGLLYIFMQNICEPKSMKFVKHMPDHADEYFYDFVITFAILDV